ncbi:MULTISPECIES: sigma-54 dependent transcriptional regulator [unclassified Burkholderia]|uniref:sigma-54 dependent transcriptional regulator n=1 Tax=unclassified Burkholderia TaxID=2613784 RepID=UPI00197DAFF2|nr:MULTISPECIES: sigma-54 dependent transcriptional regulator [unclassified Burkholderia]MBN3768403.1 sigma-54-dependent Fis family transcriptional regulator [Burkholderia sp. Se-20378]MBN3793645.1 sigma-54-dependent Fis family transcriptional regulator [Burkholderia sp. Ac-20392]
MPGTTKPREVIYWTKKPDTSLIKELSRNDWKVVLIEDSSKINRIEKSTKGGILDLQNSTADELVEIDEFCLEFDNVGWVAIIDKQQSIETTVLNIIKTHCFDYITIPTKNQEIIETVGRAYGMERLFSQDISNYHHSKFGMIGASNPMLKLFNYIYRMAKSDAPVHIYGETGTGKELTASAIHQCSSRVSQPFVALNCGAIPPHLLQSELFGYERGAFTGASASKIGLIETANHGTLFLDEIGDLPLESQVSLLRFLQNGNIFRLGATRPISVDVRIVTATHVDLEKASQEGNFRTDLYHRLCVLRIEQPTLRARGKDIELLAHHVINQFRGDGSGRVYGLSPDAIAALHSYEWPGNVRELINRIRRALVMTNRRFITAGDLELDKTAIEPQSTPVTHKSVTREMIENKLIENGGLVSRAARELGVSRATLYRWMELYAIERTS